MLVPLPSSARAGLGESRALLCYRWTKALPSNLVLTSVQGTAIFLRNHELSFWFCPCLPAYHPLSGGVRMQRGFRHSLHWPPHLQGGLILGKDVLEREGKPTWEASKAEFFPCSLRGRAARALPTRCWEGGWGWRVLSYLPCCRGLSWLVWCGRCLSSDLSCILSAPL